MQKKILLAEDDLDDRQFFYEYLYERPDVILLPAVENGEILFEYLKKSPSDLPDVIILDQNMPKQNGLQTLALLKENPLYAHIPVMIYSTYVNEILKDKSIAMGAIAVSSKPTDANGYHSMIDRFFNLIA